MFPQPSTTVELISDIRNLCIAQDAAKNKDMKIRTYGSIPLTKTFGLIEFVPYSRTMKDFMNFDSKAGRLGVPDF